MVRYATSAEFTDVPIPFVVVVSIPAARLRSIYLPSAFALARTLVHTVEKKNPAVADRLAEAARTCCRQWAPQS